MSRLLNRNNYRDIIFTTKLKHKYMLVTINYQIRMKMKKNDDYIIINRKLL